MEQVRRERLQQHAIAAGRQCVRDFLGSRRDHEHGWRGVERLGLATDVYRRAVPDLDFHDDKRWPDVPQQLSRRIDRRRDSHCAAVPSIGTSDAATLSSSTKRTSWARAGFGIQETAWPSVLAESKEKVRSALNRATRKSGRNVATASDDVFLYVWNETA